MLERMSRLGLIAHYAQYLPVTNKTPRLTLHEGDTPLIYMFQLSEMLGFQLWVKYEGLNPTGSFKDRGMVMAVAKALEEGAQRIICASTGNTSAAAAAYAARSGIDCVVLIPDGNIALGKLAQAAMYGAKIVSIDGNFDVALDLVIEIARTEPITLVNSVNPFRLEGQKTAAFEIVDRLGGVPDILAIPVGNAGNISAYWKGFTEYQAHGVTSVRPKMYGIQAAGAAPLARGLERVDNPETLATAIRIGKPASAHLAKAAVLESGGLFDLVTDDEILDAYRLLAREGIFCEPASAASVAGILKQHREGKLEGVSLVVAVLTGNGLKDPTTALKAVPVEPIVTSSDFSSVMRAIGG